MKKRYFFTTLIATFLVLQSFAQILEPVKWSFSTNKISETEYELILNASIDEKWHLYSQFIEEGGPIPTSFTFESNNYYELIDSVSENPKPTVEYDETFMMDLGYFANNATFTQRIKVLSEDQFKIIGVLEFMCCDDERCLPPKDVDFEFTINEQAEEVVLVENESPIDLENKSLWFFFFVSFLAGLAAIFTPCVFPMIPMTVTFFMHDSESKAKSRFQAIVYGFSIIAIYTIAGTIVAITLGANFANWLSTHWLPNIFFFLIFVVFAASFLGMFEITLPSWMVNKADKQADKGGVTGAFFMAFTLVLVSFSCTGPLVGAILVESAGGQVLKPIIGMFGFSLAFALPFTLFAFFPAWLGGLPKSGGWLNSVKVILGFIELALGLKFLSIADQTYHWGILDREIYLAFWIVIFALMGFYLLGKLKFSHDSDLKFISVPRLIMAIITFTFVIYLIPGMIGAPLKALSGYLPPQTTHDFDLHATIREGVSITTNIENEEICDKPKYADFLHLPHGLNGYFDYEQGLACAKKNE
jgi:thiol:disulfide interchange protein